VAQVRALVPEGVLEKLLVGEELKTPAMHRRITICRKWESKNEIAGLGCLNLPIPAISNAGYPKNRLALNHLES